MSEGFEIRAGVNQPIVRIHKDGTVTHGEGYTPDNAARAFWQAVRDYPAENDRLREALREYGQHKPRCAYRGEDWPCICGLDEALGDTPDE